MSPRGQRQPAPPRPSFASCSNALLLAICDRLSGDGHGIYKLEMLTNLGVPLPLALSAVQTLHSDGSYKGSIFPSGTPPLPDSPSVSEMDGIYSLDLYRRLCRDLGLSDEAPFYGRGTNARTLHARIVDHLKTRPEPEGAPPMIASSSLGEPDYSRDHVE